MGVVVRYCAQCDCCGKVEDFIDSAPIDYAPKPNGWAHIYKTDKDILYFMPPYVGLFCPECWEEWAK